MTHPADKELDDYLRRDSQVSERYRTLDADDVPPALDAAVMAQARAAVAQPAKPMKSKQRMPAWVRWGSPLALAASAVLVVAIVLEVGVQDELRVPAPKVQQATNTQMETKKTDAPATAPAESSSEERAVREIVERPLAAVAQDSQSFGSEPRPMNAPQPAVAPPPPQAERARQAAKAEQPAQQLSAFPDTSARRTLEEVIVSGSNIQSVPEDAAIAVDVYSQEPELKSNDKTRPAFGPRAPGALRAARAGAQAGPLITYATPELWIDAIRKLRVDGKNLEADDQWRAFRREYPDFAVREGDAALPEPQR